MEEMNNNTINRCKDDQTSADANEAGRSTGAMSYALISRFHKEHYIDVFGKLTVFSRCFVYVWNIHK
jgi:hypothetical protein